MSPTSEQKTGKERSLGYFRIFLKLPVVLILWVCLLLFVSEAHCGGSIALNSFEHVARESGPSLEFTVIGNSLLEKKRLLEAGHAQLQVTGSIRKAFLIWSGELQDSDERAGKIRFVTPSGEEHAVRAQRLWRKKSAGSLYSAWAEVSEWVTGSGRYGVKGLATDRVEPKGKDPYTVAGWALVALTDNNTAKKAARVVIFSGLEILKPGEIYDMPLPVIKAPGGDWEISKLAMVGGHGRAGNGSGNLLNGRALSGGDDWDGSSGKFWDIDLFSFASPQVVFKEKISILTVDPLLQWLYPIAVVLQLSPRESGK